MDGVSRGVPPSHASIFESQYNGSMETSQQSEASERLRLTLDLYAAGEAMMLERLRCEHPEDTPEQIEGRLRIWLQTRPGAENGDAEGRPRLHPFGSE